MKRYVIERNVPGIGAFDAARFREASQKSLEAIRQLGYKLQWEHSYVGADTSYCIYLATDEDVIRKHAELTGFPASRIVETPRIVDPTWAE
jgi:hypothetical protein